MMLQTLRSHFLLICKLSDLMKTVWTAQIQIFQIRFWPLSYVVLNQIRVRCFIMRVCVYPTCTSLKYDKRHSCLTVMLLTSVVEKLYQRYPPTEMRSLHIYLRKHSECLRGHELPKDLFCTCGSLQSHILKTDRRCIYCVMWKTTQKYQISPKNWNYALRPALWT